MIVWSRLVKASVSNGERGFARSVPGRVVASVLIGNSCQTQTLQGLGRMGVWVCLKMVGYPQMALFRGAHDENPSNLGKFGVWGSE